MSSNICCDITTQLAAIVFRKIKPLGDKSKLVYTHCYEMALN